MVARGRRTRTVLVRRSRDPDLDVLAVLAQVRVEAADLVERITDDLRAGGETVAVGLATDGTRLILALHDRPVGAA